MTNSKSKKYFQKDKFIPSEDLLIKEIVLDEKTINKVREFFSHLEKETLLDSPKLKQTI